jgi:hypothetical protein
LTVSSGLMSGAGEVLAAYPLDLVLEIEEA